MLLNTPVENPNIPSELVKQVTSVRNQITLGDAEIKRLNGLAGSLKYEISEAVKQKIDIEDLIKTLTTAKELLSSNISDLTDQKLSLTNENEKIKKLTKEKTTSLQEREDAVAQSEKEIAARREQLDSDEAEFSLKASTHEADKTVFQARVDKLNEALS